MQPCQAHIRRAEVFAMRGWVVSGILNTTAASELVQQGLSV